MEDKYFASKEALKMLYILTPAGEGDEQEEEPKYGDGDLVPLTPL